MTKRLLSGSLLAIAAGVLAQALLAGMFLSGTGTARTTHVIVGAVLPYLAFVPAVVAWRRNRGEVLARGDAISATLLLVSLWVQEALGHMPFSISTVIHVPFGVVLFSLALVLGMRAYEAGA